MLASAVALVVAAGLLAGAVRAEARATPHAAADPGSGFGYGFDTCDAPSQRAMDAWHQHSHFSAVGVYIAGMNRACDSQRHLDRRWVREQRGKGWRLLPIVVGRQAACSPPGWYRGKRISAKPAGLYRTARAQGVRAAAGGAAAARRLGLPQRTVLWYDLEAFDTTRTHCRRSALHFVSSWTEQLRREGFRSGLYSSASTIRIVEPALEFPDIFTMPGYLWFAQWDGKARVATPYLSREGWWPHRRVKQFRGGHDERHGGVRLNIDSNYYSVGAGIWVRRERARDHCRVRISYPHYPLLERGDRGRGVRAAQCVLKDGGHFRGRITGRYDRRTARAVRSFQRRVGPLAVSGALTPRTWVALLARGDRQVVKYGAQGVTVRRAQRTLNATRGRAVPVDGVFGQVDAAAVRRYQRRHDLRATGVLNHVTWRLLQRGVR